MDKPALTALLILFTALGSPLAAQSWNLPADGPNSRFGQLDYIPPGASPAVRPKLSLYGFGGHPDGHALGVQQVLERAFGVSGGVDEDTHRLFERIARAAGQNPSQHYDRGRCAAIEEECTIEMNAEHLEAQAFVALMAFVISLNDYDASSSVSASSWPSPQLVPVPTSWRAGLSSPARNADPLTPTAASSSRWRCELAGGGWEARGLCAFAMRLGGRQSLSYVEGEQYECRYDSTSPAAAHAGPRGVRHVPQDNAAGPAAPVADARRAAHARPRHRCCG